MTHLRVQTESGPVREGAYSAAVVAGELCFVSGQLPLDPITGIVAEDARGQTRQALRNLFAVLELAGFRVSELTSVSVMLADIAHWEPMNDVYAEMMLEHGFPARTAVEVGALPLGALIEIAGTAVRAERD